MKKLSAAVFPLVLAACAPPSFLQPAEELGLAVTDAAAPRGAPADLTLFPDYQPRSVNQPGDWRQLNRDQAPEGALE